MAPSRKKWSNLLGLNPFFNWLFASLLPVPFRNEPTTIWKRAAKESERPRAKVYLLWLQLELVQLDSKLLLNQADTGKVGNFGVFVQVVSRRRCCCFGYCCCKWTKWWLTKLLNIQIDGYLRSNQTKNQKLESRDERIGWELLWRHKEKENSLKWFDTILWWRSSPVKNEKQARKEEFCSSRLFSIQGLASFRKGQQ